VEQILREVNQLVADASLQNDLKATASNVRTVSERAIELADKTGAVLDNAETLTRNLNERSMKPSPSCSRRANRSARSTSRWRVSPARALSESATRPTDWRWATTPTPNATAPT
jgi:hypothetical protein